MKASDIIRIIGFVAIVAGILVILLLTLFVK
jgi:hypothetical protein